MKIAIFSIRAPIAMDIAQKLSVNHDVIVIDTYKPLMFTLSKLSRNVQFRQCPSLDQRSFDGFFQTLVKDVDIIIPTCEEGYHDYFQHPKCLNPKNIGLYHSKIDFLKVVSNIFNNKSPEQHTKKDISIPQADIKTPYGIIHLPHTSIYAPAKHKSYTIEASVVKKKFSRFGEDVYIKPKNISFINEAHNPWLIQEYQSGTEVFAGAYAYNGKLLACSIGEPILRHKNSASFGIKNHENPLIHHFIEKFVEATEYTGFIGFDILVKEKWIGLIECNPRATSAIHLIENLSDVMFDKQEPIYKDHIVLKPMLLLHPIQYLKKAKTIHKAYCPIFNQGFKSGIGAICDSLYYTFNAFIDGVSVKSMTTKHIRKDTY